MVLSGTQKFTCAFQAFSHASPKSKKSFSPGAISRVALNSSDSQGFAFGNIFSPIQEAVLAYNLMVLFHRFRSRLHNKIKCNENKKTDATISILAVKPRNWINGGKN
jgi:hypothetical protein